MPGNIGVRVIEPMPMCVSEIWRERKDLQDCKLFPSHIEAMTCDEQLNRMPNLMEEGDPMDNPTDEDSDAGEFELEVSIECS